jgi:hypothetical protein
MSAQLVIGAVHRLVTLPNFARAAIEGILGATLHPEPSANPEHVVTTAALEEGPFATAELVEPGPYSRLSERRLVLTPSGALSFADLAGWYGPGTPIHLDGAAEDPFATVGYSVEGHEIAFTFSVGTETVGEVRFVTIRRTR